MESLKRKKILSSLWCFEKHKLKKDPPGIFLGKKYEIFTKNSKLFQKCFVYLIWSMFRENVKLIISKFRNFEFWFINFYSNFIKFTFNSPYSWLQLNICLSPRWPRLIFQGHSESKIAFILFLISRTESRDLHINQANF